MNIRPFGVVSLIMAVMLGTAHAEENRAFEKKVSFEISAQPLSAALVKFSEQSGIQVAFPVEDAQGIVAPAVAGELTPIAALDLLLQGSGLTYALMNEGRIVTIRPVSAAHVGHDVSSALRLAQSSSPEKEEGQGEDAKEQTVGESQDEEDPERSGIPEILVTGSKLGTLSTDIKRTEDDIQPYVVFDREQIERSGALNLEDFFKKNLTMNVEANSASQDPGSLGNTSSINLRGLGSDETLILVDGRRVAGINASGSPQQADINGIPLAAIERIEVLPATASGIYGGGATGGVINVVLRRDYTGLSAKLTYGNTFASDVSHRRIDLSGGWSSGSGKTNMLLAGSYTDSNPLLVQERTLVQRGRQHVLDHNPNSFYTNPVPPLGSTPNIRSVDGTDLVLKDGTSLGSPITHIPAGYAGAGADGGAPLVTTAGEYNLALSNTAQSFGGARHALLNSPTVESLMVTLRHELSPQVQTFLGLDHAETSGHYVRSLVSLSPTIPATAPNNPFQQAIRMSVPTVGADAEVKSDVRSDRAVAGLIVALPENWQAGIDVAWHRSAFSFSFPPGLANSARGQFNNGSIDVLKDVNLFPIDYSPLLNTPTASSPSESVLRSAALRLGGALPWELPGGRINVASLLESRNERFGESILRTGGLRLLFPERSQSVNSAYAELRLPLVSFQNKVPGVQLLEGQLAVRWDDYTVRGSTDSIDLNNPTSVDRFTRELSSVDPTIGLRYQPLEGLVLRASYGTGFLPPAVHQLAPVFGDPFVIDGSSVADPLRGNEPLGSVRVSSEGSGALQPEQSESWSLGAILTPASIPDLRISLDWTQIDKRDNITTVAFFGQDMFEVEGVVPGVITRGPVPDGDPFPIGPVIAMNSGLFNIASLSVEAVDLAIDYDIETRRYGAFELSFGATELLSLQTQLTSAAPVVQNAGVSTALSAAQAGGLKWRANGTLVWRRAHWSLGWTTRFFDSYYLNTARTVVQDQGSATVPSQTYHDLFGSFRFGPQGGAFSSGMLSDVEVQFGVTNVFNTLPPVDVIAGQSTGLYYSRWADPRLASYYLSLQKSFD